MSWIRTTVGAVGGAGAWLALSAMTAVPAGAVDLDRLDDERGDAVVDYGVGLSYGPSFTPAVDVSSVDVEWATVKQVGSDYLVELKVENVFVYVRDYSRSGDRRDLNVAEQRVYASYRGVEVSARPDQTGTAFAAELAITRYADGTSERCDVAGRVTFSRVHDLVGITLPGACLPDEMGLDFFIVGANMVLTRQTAVGPRTVSKSERRVYDTANNIP